MHDKVGSYSLCKPFLMSTYSVIRQVEVCVVTCVSTPSHNVGRTSFKNKHEFFISEYHHGPDLNLPL